MSPIFAVVLLTHIFSAYAANEIKLANWTYYAHQCKGGQVTILNKNSIKIEQFTYDGSGPEAWFQIGLVKTGRDNIPHPCANHRRHPIIPDDKGQCSTKPREYAPPIDLILTIPNDYRWEDIDYLGLYCYQFQHLFGFVKIPYFDTSKLEEGTTKVGGCSKEHGRILSNKKTAPVQCNDLQRPWAFYKEGVYIEKA